MKKINFLIFAFVVSTLSGCGNTSNSYTVTWLNYDGTILEIDNTVEAGTMPSYDGKTPQKSSSLGKNYVFSGWSPAIEAVKSDATYFAIFNEETISYTITWDVDGKKTTENYNYGDTPSYKGFTEKEGNDEFSYSFSGWSPEITSVTADKTYVAQYNQLVNSYTISWDVDGKKTTENYNYGEIPSYKGTIEKEGNDQYTYTFSGWSPSITSVTGNKTYTAQFTNTTNSYTITWDIEGVKTTEVYNYGEIPSYKNGTPTKASTDQYSYSFVGWSPEIGTVNCDKTYVAEFSSHTREYSVSWYNGTVLLKKEFLEYGTVPSYSGTIPFKESTVDGHYVFSGWNEMLNPICSDVSFHAKFDFEPFDFNIQILEGTNVATELIENKQYNISVLSNIANSEDAIDRKYEYSIDSSRIGSIDNAVLSTKESGCAIITVKEVNSNIEKKTSIDVLAPNIKANGEYIFTKNSDKTEILGKLEKYAFDSHLSGIPISDNSGYVRYSDRVELPTGGEYIQGYGFGLLAEGRLNGILTGEEGKKHPTYLHESISQDSLKINQYTATGSQVSDLASYITSTYWGTKLKGKTEYEWYPCLAADEIRKPIIGNDGKISGYEKSAKPNNVPVPMEKSDTGLYKKWRIYVKTDGVKGANLKYTTASSKLKGQGFNNRGVTIDDYEYIYQLLLTGSNNIIRGTEMANDSSYGIKGAQRYFNETKSVTDAEKIQAKWDEFTKVDANGNSKLGIQKGHDDTNELDYLDIELINPIDDFTAMYTLSSSLVSPLPKDLFVGNKAIKSTVKDSIQTYGTFNNQDNNAILDYTLCVGPFTLTQWDKGQRIVFARNDNWFEVGERYHIPGIDYHVIDTSIDTEKVWKQLEAGNLDSAGVPPKKVKDWKDRIDKNVFPTKGDSIFKLNVNSCTQEQWNELFGPTGKFPAQGTWDVKPWMSNSNFLDGLFYSIDRESFASKRGTSPSINFFSDSYMSDPQFGISYNSTEDHKNAIKKFNGVSNFGFDLEKSRLCFKNAIEELSNEGKLIIGTKENPTEISIHIRWMYQTDINEYGDDIKYYFETAFNDPSVCGGRVKLRVDQDAVTNWEDVYNVWMMQGRFDLAFGDLKSDFYNPLSFMETVKSNNSSGFTLNWGEDTSVVSEKNPICYNHERWSFDALYQAAFTGCTVQDGMLIA